MAEGEDRVRGRPGEQRPRRLVPEQGAGQRGRGPCSAGPECGHRDGVGGYPEQRSHDAGHDLSPPTDDTAVHRFPGAAVAPEPGRGLVQRGVQQRRRATVERMRHGDVRVQPLESVALQRQPGEQRARDAERVHRRAEVAHSPGTEEHRGAGRTAGFVSGLPDGHVQTGPG